MAAILASDSCFHRCFKHVDQGRLTNDRFSFSGSIASPKFSRLEASANSCTSTKTLPRFLVEACRMGASRYGAGLDTKMVPTKELMRSKGASRQKLGSVNGSKVAADGAKLVKRDRTSSALAKTQKRIFQEIPFTDELKVLPSEEGFSWAEDNYSAWQRTIDIWIFLLTLRLRVLFDNAKWAYLGGFSEEEQKIRRQKTASWLREQILQLGPTFVKLGQFSSTRSDLFPREFVDELAKLQDRVPAFSPEKARALIQSELGSPVDVLFKEFEDRPIAAASLGQVHRAILHNGEKVAVKVQRPGLKNLFDIDLRNLKLVAEYFQRSETFGGPTRDWIGIYDECSKSLYQEIDYINEGKNADRFRREFRNIKWVRVPLIHWDYTSTRVLTLEYVPGIKINNLDQIDARGFSHSLIAQRATESYLIQILKIGYFHADPHPGNIAIDMDGSLIYYDFGMMGEIKSFTQERLLELFYAVYEKDANKVIRCLIDLETLQPTGDLSPVRRSIQFFLDKILIQTPDQQQTLSTIGEDLFAIATDQTLCFPPSITFVMKAFSTLEGIGYSLDPEYSFAKIAAPYAQELLDVRQKHHNGAELVEEIQKQANDGASRDLEVGSSVTVAKSFESYCLMHARNCTISMPFRIQRIEEFVKQLESGDLKLRVRVLESERAARKASTLQMATMYTAMSGTFLDVGVTLSSQGNEALANGSFIGAGIFLTLAIRSMQRVKQLDKLEKMI